MALSFASLEKARAKLSEYNRTHPYFFGLREGLNNLDVSFLERDYAELSRSNVIAFRRRESAASSWIPWMKCISVDMYGNRPYT